ncbi:MAG: hypothetical protein AAB916_02195 [Patescibacteria group bacterium]
MNYLLHGPDTYRSRKKLREIIAEYRRKAPDGGLNFHACDAGEGDVGAFVSAVRSGTLFATKKLAVLERPFMALRAFDVVRPIFAETHKNADVVLVVWDEGLDTEAKQHLKEVEKYFEKEQEFLFLKGPAMARWIAKESTARGLHLSPAEIGAFAALHGGDAWHMVQEMEKMALGGESGTGRYAPRFSIFDVGDTFFSSPAVARRTLLSVIDAGEDEMRMFGYLAGYVRTLLMVKSYAERGMSVPASAHIKPFVIQKASRQVRTLSADYLVRQLSRFFEEDRLIKTGASTAHTSLLRLIG